MLLFGLTIFWLILPWVEDVVSTKKTEAIQELTNTAWSVLRSCQDRVEAGAMSLDEAQSEAKEIIRGMRYGPDHKDYFWINDMTPRMIMHPYLPRLEGRDLTDYADPHGKHLFVEFVRVVRSRGAGFVDYYWQWKDDPERIVPKVSYVRGFEPWGWIIGTGIYLQDVKAEMAAMTRGLTYALLGIFALVSLFSVFLVLRSIRTAREREAAYLALSRKGEEYRAVFEAIPDPMIVYDNQGAATYLNPAFTRLFGWTWEEVIGRRINFVPQEYLEETMAGIRLLYENEDAYVPLESKRRTKNGRIIDVIINAAIIRNTDREPIGMVVNLKDITEKKKSEQALIASEKRYRNLIDNITDIIYTHDTEGRILTINKMATITLGYDHEEIVGRHLADFMRSEHRRFFSEKYLPEILTTGRSEGITVYVDKDGADHYLEYRNVLVREEGKPPHISGSGREVTERILAGRKVRLLEENLRHAQKMEAVGTLAGGVAHDFNNLLQIIGGYVQLLHDNYRLRTREATTLARIQGAVDRAGDLVNRLLTFSRKLEPGLKALDLNHQISQAVEILERTLPKRITLTTDLGQGLSPIMGDPNQIEQVLLNLGTNARDAMPEGGSLTIATREKELDQSFCSRHPGSKPGRCVELIISDTGQGIDRESLEHIFDPFYTTKEIGQGTGLGLATTYGIIKSHHGYIVCESEVGQGATFRIYWPTTDKPVERIRPSESAPPVETSRPVKGKRETILVVDDEKDVSDIVREMLSREGYRVRTAASGEEALEACGRGDRGIDLILMDLGMPGMGGRKALEEILRRDPSARVIIASGYTADQEVRDCLEAGAAAFVSKPYHLTDMNRTIRKVLDDQDRPRGETPD